MKIYDNGDWWDRVDNKALLTGKKIALESVSRIVLVLKESIRDRNFTWNLINFHY